VSPDHLGVLSHYDAVIWYTGDDDLTRQTGQPPGTGTARLAVEEMIDVRHFLNEGGKLLFTGKNAGAQWAGGNEFRNFGFPEGWEGGEYCNHNGTQTDPPVPEFDEDDPDNADGCIAHNDDFLQYYLGAYIYASPGNTFDDENQTPYALRGTGPFDGLSWLFDETGANNQDHSATFVLGAGSGAVPDVRGLPQRGRLAAPGRGAVQPLQRHAVHVRRGRQHLLQAARQDVRPHRPHRAEAELQGLGRHRAALGLDGRRGP
jgi:Arc/MetJ family transcription regulator